MLTSEFDYDLPAAAIAQRPLARRDAARLLVDGGPAGPPSHQSVADLPGLVRPGDVVVVNDTRVLPARLSLRKPTGGAVEVLLLEPDGAPDATSGTWEALVRPSSRVPAGTRLANGSELVVEVGEDRGAGRRLVRLATAEGPVTDVTAALERHGEVPLPPYVHERLEQPDRYQTVYARNPGSVAAPTAGLHLTPEVLDGCRRVGARIETVELAVGIGTFRPIATAIVAEHQMHGERYRVPPATLAACATAERVVAVGTTTVRALEAAAVTGEAEGRTELFIHGDHEFRTVDVLLTNFHTPRSSLLVLIDAFVGPRWRELYAEARAAGYRFLSFGDAMWLVRR